MRNRFRLISFCLIASTIIVACGQSNNQGKITFSLKTGLVDGKMVYFGMGGEIDGVVNPTLQANVGDIVTINLMSGEGAEHNLVVDDFNVESPNVVGQGKIISVTFGVDHGGSFAYYCSLPGHREAGMEGKLEVTGSVADAAAVTPTMDMSSTQIAPTEPAIAGIEPGAGTDIVRDPTDLPGPIEARGPANIHLKLEAKEVVGQLAEGTTFTYWTFDGKVPGPFFRVRVGDTIEVTLKNDPNNIMSHSVDFHAVTGPGGGAVFTASAPGQETVFTFKPLNPGLYVYHCATPMVAMHIANGMYGLILVEPEAGLPEVDREFYVMQGDIYTTGKFGETGMQSADVNKLLDETPDYYVLNGAVGALTTAHPLTANVGDVVRIYFGVGGPNKTSAFHVIGEIFDRVYNLASITSPPSQDVQTTLVPPGGATIVEFGLQVPGRYILVDHALSRLQRGLAGFLIVEGAPNNEIFSGTPMPGSGH